MATYIILSRFHPDAFREPGQIRELAARVKEKIKAECPKVHWKDSYATMGEYDVVDVVESDDPQQVMKAAMIIRAHGHASTETLPGRPWQEFLGSL